MKIYKLLITYLFFYAVFGILVCLLAVGCEESLRLLKTTLGAVVILSSFLASAFVILIMGKRLLEQPYPYFMLGFYVGNLSILLTFFIYFLLNNYMVWRFPEFLLIFSAPIIGLLLSYMLFGFAFLVLIPSCLSAYVLFKIVKNIPKFRAYLDKIGR